MVTAHIYIEGGGGQSKGGKDLDIRCQEGFRKFIAKLDVNFMPRLVACGGRRKAYDRFRTKFANRLPRERVALFVDSEAPLTSTDPWQHLMDRDGWTRPNGAQPRNALLMVCCMETWLVADRPGIVRHYGASLKTTALPPLTELDARPPELVVDALERATESCSNRYDKGKRAFDLLGQIDPYQAAQHSESCRRCIGILETSLG